jgi:hypothetical protein
LVLTGVSLTVLAEVAISPNSEEVQIYKKSGNTWTQTTVLGEVSNHPSPSF